MRASSLLWWLRIPRGIVLCLVSTLIVCRKAFSSWEKRLFKPPLGPGERLDEDDRILAGYDLSGASRIERVPLASGSLVNSIFLFFPDYLELPLALLMALLHLLISYKYVLRKWSSISSLPSASISLNWYSISSGKSGVAKESRTSALHGD